MRKRGLIALVAAALMAAATASAQTGKVHSNFDLLCSYYGICVNSTISDNDVLVGTSATVLSNSSPAAVEIVYTNNSANQCSISNSDLVTSTTGTQLAANASIAVIWSQDFDTVGAPWFAACSAAGSSIHVHKVSLN